MRSRIEGRAAEAPVLMGPVVMAYVERRGCVHSSERPGLGSPCRALSRLAESQAAGNDHLTQTKEVVRAVLQTFPDMTSVDALAEINRLRRG